MRHKPGARRREEIGAVAILIALFFAFIALPLGAITVDVARLYVELQRVQAAADAAATAGVTFMPDDLASASARAVDIAGDNGFPNSGSSRVEVSVGEKPTQLKVTVSSTVSNAFARTFGASQTTVSRSAVADFNGPAPMGSPCNAFANEPSGSVYQGPTTSVIQTVPLASCPAIPQFWAQMSGPEVAKDQGSQFEARKCAGGEDGCANGSSGALNTEFEPRGLIYLVRVTTAAIGRNVELQIYDPAAIPGGPACASVPTSSGSFAGNSPNTRLNDALTTPPSYTSNSGRYVRAANTFCAGDDPSSTKRFPSGTENPTVTSFGLRAPVDTLNPYSAPPITTCAKQYPGYASSYATVNRLTSTHRDYDDELAKVFHQWNVLCSFTPTQAGDYYLQVRTNVPAGNAQAVFSQTGDNSAAIGNTINSFALRANTTAPAGAVSISAYERMRIFANANTATTTFNLVRVGQAAANKTLLVSFFDVGEGSSNGAVTFIPPADSNMPSTPVGCTGDGVTDGNLAGCRITGITSTNYNGKIQYVRIPIPGNYSCTSTSTGGCWFRVSVTFGTGSVQDATTWTAKVVGEPVRLIE